MGRAGRLPYLVLLQTGYAEHAASPRHLVGSCPTVSPLPRTRRGGLLSVALSEGRPSWVLPSVLPCGARTFLPGHAARGDGLSHSRYFVLRSCVQTTAKPYGCSSGHCNVALPWRLHKQTPAAEAHSQVFARLSVGTSVP